MHDVYISLDELRRVSTELGAITEELANAGSNTDALQAAIGFPFGRSELRNQAGDFESRWDIKREQLAEDLTKVLEHVDGVIEGVETWDADTAISLDPPVCTSEGSQPSMPV